MSMIDRHLKQMNQNILHYFDYPPGYSDEDPDMPLTTRLEDNIKKLILRASALERELNITRTLGAEERKKLFLALGVEDRGQDLKTAYNESIKDRDSNQVELFKLTDNIRLLCKSEDRCGGHASNVRADSRKSSELGSSVSRMGRSMPHVMEETHNNLLYISHCVGVLKETLERNEEIITALTKEIELLEVKRNAYDAMLASRKARGGSHPQREKSMSKSSSFPLPPVDPRSAAYPRSGMRTPPPQPTSSPNQEPVLIKASDILKCCPSADDSFHFHRLKGRTRSKQRKRSPNQMPQPFPFQELYAQAKAGSIRVGYTNSLSLRQMELLAKHVGVSVHKSQPGDKR